MSNCHPSNADGRQSDGPKARSDEQRTERAGTAPKSKTSRFGSIGSALRWALAIAACLWLAGCTALGPIYWQFYYNPSAATITSFSWNNAALFARAFIIYSLVVVELVRFARGQRLLPRQLTDLIHNLLSSLRRCISGFKPKCTRHPAHRGEAARQPVKRFISRFATVSRLFLMRITNRSWVIMLTLIIGWLWVPTTLVTAFGADIHNQFREFSWAWNQWTGLKQPYIGFFSFVPMDIYPTAHYLWPDHPVYLTDQHNIVLTLIYGGVGTISRYFTGSNDWGLAALASSQFLFAAFCVAATMNRFFNCPWLNSIAIDTAEDTAGTAESASHQRSTSSASNIGALPRFGILLFFLTCPLVLFSTISLTKSPLFAFAFVWWFGIGYELLSTATTHTAATDSGHLAAIASRSHKTTEVRSRISHSCTKPARQVRKRTQIALILSTLVMLISAKYAMYIVAFEVIVALIADNKRWKTYVIGMLLPLILFEGVFNLAVRDGLIITGDPIESHGVQLQQIARVAALNPNGIPQDARDKLAPIFNLDQMADAYSQQDADPVKSSGIQAKKVSYRWRTVTEADMKNFNSAWLEIVKANPRIAMDALISKSYGYFDIQDQPYIDMTYYVTSAQNPNFTDWIGDWCSGWRKTVTDFVKNWSSKPIIGWLIHGNTYVIITLLIGAAEVVLRRWRTLVMNLPLLLLMGVMIMAPANNFERHMLPVVFTLSFVLLTFWLQSRRAAPDTSVPDSTQPSHQHR
ncbi:hypothetical protein FHX77_000903 [Bifidobacterium commune]|uniref:Uncharacterized protein n=1 Tax=Bifidobacterium commune TaxID=1505727 RepID=A0A1C4GZ63_9BIFI|nr:DUF6020 family protein [Bifidobacterium commune]MBB2955485.1 hypothetical protein [Bifidobacterium commune]SCC77943.1 hypothetical protein GA0061077_0013 [Bifidobacterium commune]